MLEGMHVPDMTKQGHKHAQQKAKEALKQSYGCYRASRWCA